MSKRFLIILLALFTVFIGVIIFSKQDEQNNADVDTASGSSHISGGENTPVTLVEFGDFQCPACASYYPVLDQVKDEYGDKITFQFRHFPLVNIHPNAMAAHRAAEAAGQQEKFWEMHDLLYQRQQLWKDSQNPAQVFEDYATELGLNIDQYKGAVSSQAVLDVINADIKIGQDVGAQSTPTFVLNGEVLENAPQSFEGFQELIDAELAKQNQ
jgi:protein-disulfide isomerase